MKRLLYGLVAGVLLAGTFVAPSWAAPAAPRPADTLAELGDRAVMIDILMEDHKGQGLWGTPRKGFGTPRALSEGFPVVAERTYCDQAAPTGQQVMVPPACLDPPDGPPPTYALRIYPLLDVAYEFRLHNRSIYVLENENRALVVQKEHDGWRFLPIFETAEVRKFVDFRIGGGMAPMARDANNRLLTTAFSLVGDDVIRQTTKLGKTAYGNLT